MIPEIDTAFSKIKKQYGSDAIQRIELMMNSNPADRTPLQKDAKWIVPGLSKGGWLEVDSYPQLKMLITSLEQNATAIKKEIVELIEIKDQAVNPYQHYLKTQNNWKALYLFKDGQKTAYQSKVPSASKILDSELRDWLCPLLEMHFSILEPGAKIAPHCDLWNFTINLHLAIEIPNDCGIRVENETRNWEEGKCLLFDYSYQHEAWNNSEKNRICLLIDIWHPDLSIPERLALTSFITEIRKYF